MASWYVVGAYKEQGEHEHGSKSELATALKTLNISCPGWIQGSSVNFVGCFQAALVGTKYFGKVFFLTRIHCPTPGALLIPREQLATPDSQYIADLYVDIPVKST